MAKSKEKKTSIDKVRKKKDGEVPSRKRILKERNVDIQGELIPIQLSLERIPPQLSYAFKLLLSRSYRS